MDKEFFKKISRDKLIIESRLNSVRKTLKIKTDKYVDMVIQFGIYCAVFLCTESFDYKYALRTMDDIEHLQKVIKEYERQFNDLLFESKRIEKQLEDIRNGES